MSAIILESQSSEDLKLLVTLASKLGIKSQKYLLSNGKTTFWHQELTLE
jgi:hypothetical protein